MKKLLPFLLSCLSCCLHAQKVDGVWKGTMRQQAGGCFPVYYTELDIKIEGEKVSGVSYHYPDVTNYVKKTIYRYLLSPNKNHFDFRRRYNNFSYSSRLYAMYQKIHAVLPK
ncbi:MAG: hypothetical protein C4329_01150 [Chitinophagaceae bacterium]